MDPRLVRAYITLEESSTDEASSTLHPIIQSIRSGQATLLSLVQVLGEYLTNEDALVRAKGTGLLSSVLLECPSEQVNTSTVLVDFYCDRLADTPSVPQLLKGLTSLQQLSTFTDENAIKVSRAIFESVKVQSLQQIDRHIIFQLFDGLLQRHLNALRQMGSNFVFGFIQVMDGEKDPRNLLLAFALVKFIIENFDISEHVEDLFEVTFCYFPITFKPPPDDIYGITADDLKLALRECLSATPHFANHAMPLLLEKLSSSSGNAKKDSMEALAACAPVYGPHMLIPYLEDLWNTLKVEIFHATDDSLETFALGTIRSIVSTLSTGIVVQSDPTERFLTPIITECMEYLKEPELKLAKPSGRILKYCAMASDSAYNTVINSSLNGLLKIYRGCELATQKKGVLEVLLEFIEASQTLYGSIEDDQMDIEGQDLVTPLLAFKEEYLEIFTNALLASNEYSEFRLTGLKGLHKMIMHKKFLSDNEVKILLQHFDDIILTEPDQDIVSEVLGALANITHYKPNIVLEISIPAFIDELPNYIDNVPMELHGISRKATYSNILDALSNLAIEPLLFETLVPKLLTKLDGIYTSNLDDNKYPRALLSTLLTILMKKAELGHSDIPRCADNLVPRLLAICVGPTLEESDHSSKNPFCDLVSGIILVVTRCLNAEMQAFFIRHMFDLYMRGITSFLLFSADEKERHIISFSPLMAESSSNQQNLAVLFTAAVGSMRQEVPIPVPNKSDFLSNLLAISLSTPNETLHSSLAKLAASIVNKWEEEPELKGFLELKVLGELRGQFASPLETEERRRVSLEHFLWFTKALILRADVFGFDCAGHIINQFGDVLLGKQASQGFGILTGEDDILNKQNFSRIKLLYKQRFFNYCMPILVNGFKVSDDEVKHNYLIALSYLLCNVPRQIFLAEIPPLFPSLLHSLSLPDPELKTSTCQTFYIITQDAPDIISEHVATLVPLLLSLTKVTNTNTMGVRIAALRCLGLFPDKIRFDILYPYKNEIISELLKALDDKKRMVRKEAVECRNKWFLFTGPKSS